MSRSRTVWDAKGKLAEFENGECIWLRDDYDTPNRSEIISSPMIIRDIEPYKNMIDGKMITSRREHRELLKRHNCIEIGNEKMEAPKMTPPDRESRRKVLHKQLGDMSDKQANKILKQLKKG